MKDVSGWSRVLLRFSMRWACVAAAICLVAALTPESVVGAGPPYRLVQRQRLDAPRLHQRHSRAEQVGSGVADAPHQNFWDKLSYTEFTTGNVPGVDAGPKPPYRILVVGDAANSNLVMALQGKGPLFNKDNGEFGRMPANAEPPGMPYFTDAQIQPIIDWINRGCPNPGGT